LEAFRTTGFVVAFGLPTGAGADLAAFGKGRFGVFGAGAAAIFFLAGLTFFTGRVGATAVFFGFAAFGRGTSRRETFRVDAGDLAAALFGFATAALREGGSGLAAFKFLPGFDLLLLTP